jgi:hypothetical protein
MAITLVASVNITPSGNDGGTSASITTTGATLIVISTGSVTNAPTVSDSKGNTYTRLTTHQASVGRHTLYYKLAPTVGTGHTFTLAGTDIYAGAIVFAFAGVVSYYHESGNATTGGSPLASGSITPPTNGALIITGLGANDPATNTITPSGFTQTSLANNPNIYIEQSAGWLVQTTAAAINPTWAWSGGTGHPWTMIGSAVFLDTAVPLPTPVAYWPFSEATGTTAADASGNGHTATLNHGTWDTSALKKFGAAALANTEGGYGASVTEITLGTVYTIAYWVNGWGGSLDGKTLTGTNCYATYQTSTNMWHAAGGNLAAAGAHGGLTGSHHVVVTRDGTAVRFYKDGVLLTATTIAGGAAFKVDAISGALDGTDPLIATLDDVRLYSTALTGGEVLALYALVPSDPVTLAARVTQAAVEVLGTASAGAVGGRVTQSVLEVLYKTSGLRWKLYIAGTEQTPLVDSLSITWALNERTRATAVLSDVIPDRYAEITSTDKSGVTLLFGGLILSRAFAGRNQYDPDFQMTLDCGDWFAATDWVHATLTYAAEVTLKQVLVDLVDAYLAQYGITVSPFQSDGPTLAPFSWASKRVSDAIRELTDRTGYVATMSPVKWLRMIFPGTLAAPFAITEGATHIQELSWRDHDQGAGSLPPNTVKVIAGPTGAHDRGYERQYGDGVKRVWELDALFITEIGALHVFSEGAGGYPLATYGVDFWPDGQDYPWSQDPVTNTIRQRADQPVLAADDYWWLDGYIASYPMTVTATCPEMDDSPAPPVIEHVEIRTDVMSRPVAQEIADALIAQLGGCAGAGGPPEVITFRTDEDGVEVGQALTVDLPTTRSIAGEFVVTSVAMTIVLDPDADTEPYWLYTVEAQDSDLYQGSYLTDWRKLTGTGGDAAAGAGGGVSTGGGALMQSPAYLGGSRGVSVSASPVAWLPVVNYVPFVAPASFLARVRVELFALNPGVTAQARLYNVTNAAAVASSSVVTSLTAVAVSFGADVEIGKTYRLEVIAGTAAEGVFAIGTLEAA